MFKFEQNLGLSNPGACAPSPQFVCHVLITYLALDSRVESNFLDSWTHTMYNYCVCMYVEVDVVWPWAR